MLLEIEERLSLNHRYLFGMSCKSVIRDLLDETPDHNLRKREIPSVSSLDASGINSIFLMIEQDCISGNNYYVYDDLDEITFFSDHPTAEEYMLILLAEHLLEEAPNTALTSSRV